MQYKEAAYKGGISAKPTLMMLEVTNACNQSCLFCDHNKMTRNVVNMDYNFAVRIMREGYEMGIREIALFLMTEPLIYKNLDKLIKAAKEIGYEYVYITTNGTLATLDRMKVLIHAGLDSIKFSINAIDRVNYAVVHGKDDYDTVIQNLKNLYTYKNENNLKLNIFISSIKTKYNPSRKKIHAILGKWCDEIVVENYIDKLDVNSNSNLKVDSLEDDGVDIIVGNKMPCQMLFNRICVTAEGYLTACCSDIQNAMAYADLKVTPLNEAWTNELITSVRLKHLEGNYDNTLCKICAGMSGIIVPLCKEFGNMVCNTTDRNIEMKRVEEYNYLGKI